MKPTITFTFDKYEDFKIMRDLVEASDTSPKWKYGASEGKHYLQFFNGTTPHFIFNLGVAVATEHITYTIS